MNIHLIKNPTADDFTASINMLNKVFSKFRGHSEYNALTAFEKTKGKDSVIFEVVENNQLVGFAIGYERYEGYYHVWQLGVDEKHRGKSVATTLYEKIEKYAKDNGYKGVTLNTFNRYKLNIRLIIGRRYEIYDLDKSGDCTTDPKILLRKIFK